MKVQAARTRRKPAKTTENAVFALPRVANGQKATVWDRQVAVNPLPVGDWQDAILRVHRHIAYARRAEDRALCQIHKKSADSFRHPRLEVLAG